MDLKPYPTYKDSGVEWLRKVPVHWSTERLKSSMNNVVEQTTERRGADLYVALEHVEGWTGRIRHTSLDVSFDSQVKYFRSGDVLFGKLRPYLAKVTRPTSEGVCVGEFLVLRPRHANATAAYMEQLLRSKPIVDAVNSSTFGAKMPRADWQFMGGMAVVLPPIPEQAAIVRFLDYADRRIRRYIRAKQKLVTLLEEQKQALIHRAVTGKVDIRTGLPYPAYKPSGVEWLGDVPEHWERARLKACLLRPMRNGLFKKKDAFGSGVPLVNVADIYRDSFQIDPASLERVQTTPDEMRTYQVRTGDLFFVRSSLKLEGTARSAVAIDCEAGSVFECHLVQGRPDPRRAVARFLAFQLNSFSLRHYLISRANVVTMATVSQGVLASCPIFLPSISEQERLLKQIDGECTRVGATHYRARREIDLLHEYRTRLIADVVTGKLDVREAASRLPDEVEEPEPLDETDALTEGKEEPSDDLDTTPEEAAV